MYTSPVEIHSCGSTKEVSVHHTSHAKASRYTNKQSINSRNVIKIYNIRSCHTSLDCIISSKSSVPSSTMTASTPKLKPVKRISVLLLSLQNKTKKLLQELVLTGTETLLQRVKVWFESRLMVMLLPHCPQ